MWELGKSKICRAGKQETQGGTADAAQPESCLEAEFPPPQRFQTFLFSPSADWMRPTHTVEGTLLIDLNMNFH